MAATNLPTGDTPVPENAMSAWLLNRIYRASKLAKFLYVQRISGFTVADAPVFVEPESAPLFAERLAVAGSYLEFGSGGSTVLAAKVGVPFVSVESDRFFLRAVRRKLRGIGRLDPDSQTFLYADIGLTEAWGAPAIQAPTPERVARWRRYPLSPWSAFARLPSPHLILVDGRFRVACALAAAKFLQGRAGEILIDDYTGRDHYRGVERHLQLRGTGGRMGLFMPRPDLDAATLDTDIEAHCADWR